MNRITRAILLIVGLVNAFPLIGIASAGVLSSLYGIPAMEGDLVILMRHRALLFGLLGVFIGLSAFKSHLQPYAIAAGLVSMLGFIALAVTAGEYGAKVANVVWVDVVASIGLVAVALLRWRESNGT